MTPEEKKEYNKAYYESNKEYHKAYRKANKERRKETAKAYRESNKEKRKEYDKAYREDNKEKIKAYREANKEKRKEYHKAYSEDNEERLKAYREDYYEANKEKIKEQTKAYYEDNKEKIKERNKANYEANKERRNEYQREKTKNDPLYRLKKNLRCSNCRAWKGQAKPITTEKLLGCSYIDFKDYITAQFVGNMSWENYGDVWHIDHITPLSVVKDIEQKELIESLCHFSNLQPLFAEDNISKSDRLDYQYPEIYKTNLFHNSNKIQL